MSRQKLALKIKLGANLSRLSAVKLYWSVQEKCLYRHKRMNVIIFILYNVPVVKLAHLSEQAGDFLHQSVIQTSGRHGPLQKSTLKYTFQRIFLQIGEMYSLLKLLINKCSLCLKTWQFLFFFFLPSFQSHVSVSFLYLTKRSFTKVWGTCLILH